MNKEYSKAFQIIIGNLLREAREKAEPTMSQHGFAKRHGCSKNYISNVELGNVKLPAEVLMWYCHEFKIDANGLFKKVAAEMKNIEDRNK